MFVQVREQGQQKGEPSDYVAVLKKSEELARSQGLGRWTMVLYICVFQKVFKVV